MCTRPLLFLWGFFLNPKIYMVNIMPQKELSSAVVIRSMQQKYHIPPEHSLLLQETRELPSFLDPSWITPLPLVDLLKPSDSIVPAFHPYSRFHHDYLYRRYAMILPYSTYCTLEENVANYILLHIMDKPDISDKLDTSDTSDTSDISDTSDTSDNPHKSKIPKISKIPDPYLYIFQNEEWLWDESVLSFFTTEEKQAVDTTLLVDLDAEPELHPRVHHRLFFLDNKGRPIL